MATVNQCDRCGTIYKNYAARASINTLGTRLYNGFAFTKDNFAYQNDSAIDLCPKCLDELIEWLNSEEK